MNNKPSKISSDEDFDFGFTIETAQQAAQPVREQLTSQLQQMYNAIIPLLKNLAANPEKDIINWPNRTAKISAFKKKLDDIGGQDITTKEI